MVESQGYKGASLTGGRYIHLTRTFTGRLASEALCESPLATLSFCHPLSRISNVKETWLEAKKFSGG